MTLKVIKLTELLASVSLKNGNTLIEFLTWQNSQNTDPKSSAPHFYLNCLMFISCLTAQPSTHCELQIAKGDWGTTQLHLNMAWLEAVLGAILPLEVFVKFPERFQETSWIHFKRQTEYSRSSPAQDLSAQKVVEEQQLQLHHA